MAVWMEWGGKAFGVLVAVPSQEGSYLRGVTIQLSIINGIKVLLLMASVPELSIMVPIPNNRPMTATS
jgi:hypothetical protein